MLHNGLFLNFSDVKSISISIFLTENFSRGHLGEKKTNWIKEKNAFYHFVSYNPAKHLKIHQMFTNSVGYNCSNFLKNGTMQQIFYIKKFSFVFV